MTTAEFRKKYGLGAGTEQKDAASDREKALEEWRAKSVQRIVKPAAATVRPQTGVRTGFGVLMEQMKPSASPVVRTEPIISPLKSVETGGKYYSKPNLWTDAEQMKQRVAQTETNLKVLQRQAQDLAAAWQKSQTDTAYQMWQDVYNRYKSEYDAYTRYYDQYDAYLSDQQRQYDDWRGTIRSAEQVQSEMAAVKLMIDAVKKDRAKNYLTTPANQLPEYDARIKQYEEQLSMLEEEYDWARRFAYEDLQKNPDFAELSKYKRTGETSKKNPITGVLETTGYGDVDYEIINRKEAARQWQSVRDIQYGAALAGVDQRERTQMTDDEIAIFNYLYAQDEAAGDKNHTSAYEYIDYITKDLTYRQQQKDAEWWSTYAKENPVRSSVFSAVMSPMKAVTAVGQVADYLDDGKIDENAGYNKFSHIPSNIRGAVSESVEEKWGKVGSFAYNTGMSMADFLVNTALSGGSSGLAMTLMGSEIAADTVIDGKKRGLSDGQAFTLGIVSGLAEAVTEKFSVEALLDAAKLGKSAFGYWIKNTITEASEEGASNLINTFADIMISKEKSEWQKAINEYKAQGLSEKDALNKALGDQAVSIGLDMLGGAISGGTMAAPGVAVQGASKVTNALIDKRQNVDKPSAESPIRAEKWFEPEVAEDGTYEDQDGNRVLTDGTKIEKDGTKVLSTADTREQGKRMERAKTVTARTGVATGATDGQIKTAERLSKILGKEIRFFRQDAAADGSIENGLYRAENDVILVNAASEKGVRWVVAHELTHSTELSSEYKTLNKFVISQMQEMGVDVDAMVQQRQKLYAEHGVTLTDPDAKLEVVADFAADHLLTDEKTIRALVKGHPTVAQRILEWADKMAAKIGKTESEEDEVEIMLRKARKMYAAALADADKVRKDGTVQKTERVPEKKTERETAKEPEEAERDPYEEDGDDSLQEEAVDENIHEIFPDAQFSVTRTAKEQDAIMANLRSILQNGGTVADLRSYVDTLDAQERARAKKKPQGTNTQRRADAASQIVRAAHNADMTVEEYLRDNAELYETEDGWNRDARRALEMERGERYSISPALKEDLQKVLEGKFSAKNNEVYIGESSTFLTDTLKADALTVTMPARKAYAAMVTKDEALKENRYDPKLHYHGLGVKGLYDALVSSEDPVAAFVGTEDEKGNNRDDHIVLVTDKMGEDGNLVAVMEVDTEGYVDGHRIKVNKTITSYGRSSIAEDIYEAAQYGRLLHLDKKRSQSLFAGVPGSTSPGAIRSVDFENSIRHFWENVKWKKSGQKTFSAEPPGEQKTGMAYAFEKAQKKAEEKGQLSITTDRVNVGVDTESKTAYVQHSITSWNRSDYVQDRQEAAREISAALGVSYRKALRYIDDINGIAKMIADDKQRLDYVSALGGSSFVSNVEYGGSIDFSTLCPKRRLISGTHAAIQRLLGNRVMTAEDVLRMRSMMMEAGYEVAYGPCYVEGSRANMGGFMLKFIEMYEAYNPDAEWIPQLYDLVTPEGVEWMRLHHPDVYEQYEQFWNNHGKLRESDPALFASQQKPKLFQARTEYDGEILDKFKKDGQVDAKNRNGGLRLQSFSDFEIVHLIDCMQVIMDMARVGLAGQAYTKVPDFAWALGDTGLKINLSVIAKDVGEDGRLVMNDVDGMPMEDAVKLRERYSENVGIICLVYNDEQLYAAMADERIDFIIPFHRSQWKKSQYKAMGLPEKVKDYTYQQNEKLIVPTYHEFRGKMVKDKAKNYMPNEYWDPKKSGKENAEDYLKMCAANNKRPKFYKLLDHNADGSYSLKADGSTDGYWKLLVDFKMYDNKGKFAPQKPVQPKFNMEEAQRMLTEYAGDHAKLPVAEDIVQEFVADYEKRHAGAKGGQFSISATNAPTNTLQTKIGDLFGVPSYSRDEVIGTRLKDIVDEYKKTGEVSEETVAKVFDEIRADAVEISADLWQGQKNTLLHMQETPVFVDEDTRQKFDDWDAFEEKAEGILRITEDDTAVSVGKLYSDLLEIESGAFPENVRSPQKMLQNMYEFGRDVERAGRSVYWEDSANRDAMIEKNKKDFESAVSEWMRKTKDQERKAAEKEDKKREIAEKAEKRKDPVRSRRDLKRNLSALFSVPKEIVQRVESIIAPFEGKILSQGRLMEEDVQDLFNALYASGAVMEHVDGTVETGVSEETVIENLEREMRFQLRMFAEKAKLETDLRKAESVAREKLDAERAEHHAKTDLVRSENWALREKIKEVEKEGAEKVRQVKQENSARWNKYLNQRREQMREQREHKKKMDLAKQLLAKYKWARTHLKQAPADVKAQLEEILEGMDTLAVMPMRESKLDEKIEEYGVTWRELPEYLKWIEENDKDFIPSPDLKEKMKRVSAKKIADMDINAIGNALQVLVGLQTEFYNRKNLLIAGQFAQIDAWHDDIVAELEAAPAPNTKKVEGIWEDLMNRGQLTAVNVIRRMAGWNPESTLYKLAEMFEEAEYAMHEFEVKSREPIEEFTKKHRDWVRRADGQGKDGEWIVEKVKPLVSMKVGQAPVFGKEVEIALTPMMRVHMLLESKNAQNLRHMAGGRVFADRELYSKGKRKEAFAHGKPVKLAPSTVKEIVSKATKEELELAEILHKYYNGYSKESVNKVTNMLYGYEKAVVKEYAPIYIDSTYTKQDPGVYDATIENVGNLKERTNSWTPSLQISAIDAFDRHVDRTARFVAYAIPVRNWTMLMKWEDAGSPLKKRIAEKWGSKATEYLDTLLTEMQTGGERPKHNIIVEGLENLYSKTITAVFGLNPSVVSKQLGSLAMALPELGWENKPKPEQIAKIDRELIGKYTSELAWRASGNASVETQLMRENPNRIQRNKAVQVLTGGAITAVDQWTASVLWPWAENKVRKEYPELSVGTKEQVQAGESEIYKKVAEVFNHAVAHSQSMADQMHQSSLRKSKNPVARTFTVFKSDASQAYNQLRQYVGEARYYDRISRDKSKNEAARKAAETKAMDAKKRVGTAVLGIALNNAWSTMVTLLMALWKNKGKNYRDDDDELTVGSVMEQMTKDFLSGISSMVVGGEEIAEVFGNLITGDPFYDIETPGVDVVNEFAKLLTESAKGAGEFFSRGVNVIKDGGDFGKFLAQNAGEVLGGLKDTAVTVSSYFGIPAGNLEAYLKGTFSHIFPGATTAVEDFLETPAKSDLKGLRGKALDQRVADIMADRGVKISEESAAVLAAMYDAGHNPVIPSAVPSSVTIEEVTHDLTETQKQKYAEAWAEPVSTHLEALLNSQEYKQASADDKQLMISKVYSMGTAYAKNKLFPEYKLPTWIAEVEQFEAAKMSFPQYLEVQAAYSGIYESKADGKIKALDFAKWVTEQGFTKEQRNVIRECFGNSAETYYNFIDAGVTEYNAYRTAKAIAELKPTDGRESIVSVQKYRAVIDEQLPASQELLALSQVMTDSDYAKVQAGNAHGITPGVFVTFKELLPRFDEDGNGSLSQEEVERAIDSIGPRTGFAAPTSAPANATNTNLTNAQRAVLWQMANKSWNPSSNPYSVWEGRKVYNDMNGK